MRQASVERIEHNGYIVRIENDEDPTNPRKEYDNLATMICWHSRYNLGDEQPKCSPNEYLLNLVQAIHPNFPEDQFEAHGQNVIDKHYVMLPLFLYDHGGITMSTRPFGCPWDSGQVGFIYVTMEKARKEWGGVGVEDAKIRELAIKCLKQEVETYDKYLRGECYGFIVETEDGEALDACWGFDDLDYCIKEAKSQADYYVRKDAEAAEEKEKQQAFFDGITLPLGETL